MILMMIADRLLRLCVLALPIAAAGSLCAQSGSPQSHIPGAPPLLERVDPTIADISPLSESLREVNMQADLRLPTGFQNVYRVPGPGQDWKGADPVKVTDFPESGLFLEDPQISRDGRWLLYSRGRITGDIWIMTLGK